MPYVLTLNGESSNGELVMLEGEPSDADLGALLRLLSGSEQLNRSRKAGLRYERMPAAPLHSVSIEHVDLKQIGNLDIACQSCGEQTPASGPCRKCGNRCPGSPPNPYKDPAAWADLAGNPVELVTGTGAPSKPPEFVETPDGTVLVGSALPQDLEANEDPVCGDCGERHPVDPPGEGCGEPEPRIPDTASAPAGQVCDACEGSGVIAAQGGEQQCPDCGGSGASSDA